MLRYTITTKPKQDASNAWIIKYKKRKNDGANNKPQSESNK